MPAPASSPPGSDHITFTGRYRIALPESLHDRGATASSTRRPLSRLAQLTAAIDGSDQLPAAERHRLHGELHARRGLKRFLRTTKNGLLRVDRAAVAAEAHLDGKFLLRSSDPTLSVEDIALAYKQLLQIERAWRDMKTTLDLRPIHHRKQDRIRAHVLLCWLALLLIRIAENHAHDTWRNLRDELQRMHLGTFTGPAGTSHQRTELTPPSATSCAPSASPSRHCSRTWQPPSRPPSSSAPDRAAAGQNSYNRRIRERIAGVLDDAVTASLRDAANPRLRCAGKLPLRRRR